MPDADDQADLSELREALKHARSDEERAQLEQLIARKEKLLSRDGGFRHFPLTSAEPTRVGAVDRDYGQIRPAGIEAIRDDGGDWDQVDEGSDQSFPASDPPSFMPKRA